MPDGSGTWEKGSLKSTLNWTLGLTLVSSMPDGSGTWETGLKPILDFYLAHAIKAWRFGGGYVNNELQGLSCLNKALTFFHILV